MGNMGCELTALSPPYFDRASSNKMYSPPWQMGVMMASRCAQNQRAQPRAYVSCSRPCCGCRAMKSSKCPVVSQLVRQSLTATDG